MCCTLLVVFAKLLKATISFVMSVRMSAWNNSVFTGRNYMNILLMFFRKSVEKIPITLNYDMNPMYFKYRTSIHFWSLVPHFFLERNISGSAVDVIKTHILYAAQFLQSSCHLWDTAGYYWSAGEFTDNIIYHAHCMRNNSGETNTLRKCNI